MTLAEKAALFCSPSVKKTGETVQDSWWYLSAKTGKMKTEIIRRNRYEFRK